MYSVKPPFFFRFFNPEYLVCSLPSSGKKIYLTFDDGPVPEVTPQVLDILLRKNAKATFFCVGENVKKHRQVFDEMVSAGHAIGNHTYNHLNGWKTPPALYVENVHRCRDYFDTKLFRPPYGRFTPTQYYLLKKEFRFIMWSVLSGDFDRSLTPDKCLSRVKENSSDGSIVVFHDSIKAAERVLKVLPDYLDFMQDQGFVVDKIKQIR